MLSFGRLARILAVLINGAAASLTRALTGNVEIASFALIVAFAVADGLAAVFAAGLAALGNAALARATALAFNRADSEALPFVEALALILSAMAQPIMTRIVRSQDASPNAAALAIPVKTLRRKFASFMSFECS